MTEKASNEKMEVLLSQATDNLREEVDEIPKHLRNGHIMHEMDNYYHLLGGCFAVYLFAYYGIHYAFVLFTIWFLWRIEQSRHDKIVAETVKLLDLQASMIEREGRMEEVHWLNVFLEKYWPTASPELSKQTEDKVKKILKDYLTTSKPSSVDTIDVDEVSFGDIGPLIEHTKIVNSDEDKFGLPGIHVEIENLKIRGRMELTVTFSEKNPYIDLISMSFMYTPDIEVSIKPGKAKVGWIQGWIDSVMTNLVCDYMKHPEAVSFSMQPAPPKAEGEAPELPTLVNKTAPKKPKHRALTDKAVQVLLISGTALPSMDSNGFSDPYCVVKIGTQRIHSKTIKKTLNPEWNQMLTLPLEEEMSNVIIEVWDWDQVGNDDFMGTANVPFTSLSGGTGPTRLELPLLSKVGSRVDKATITVEVSIISAADVKSMSENQPKHVFHPVKDVKDVAHKFASLFKRSKDKEKEKEK